MDYRVVWEMEIYNAASPEEAARRARYWQTHRSQPEPVVDVYSLSGDVECKRVDLEELDQDSRSW